MDRPVPHRRAGPLAAPSQRCAPGIEEEWTERFGDLRPWPVASTSSPRARRPGAGPPDAPAGPGPGVVGRRLATLDAGIDHLTRLRAELARRVFGEA
ncbi:hypothetical protein ACFQ6C_14950 [Streptomyces sp. NPDC056454]|uniref:hypothetical protein n=1 Tax=Streptomyces sp. NPDC056454 TaxID=3345823 RepID=UPI003681BD52